MGVLLAVALLTSAVPVAQPFRAADAGLKPWTTTVVVQPFRAAVPVAQAQPSISSLIGRTITATELVLEGSLEGTEEVREFVETTPGEPLSMAEVRETIAHLFSL